ncbi:hypothetical protein FHS24_001708 [Psychrobacter luti]|uniref:ACP-like domain-containing protein n=1 Tax=Psychrobacter luti TaxID=198481 RepID=A0A839TCL9_9GAMM|nr:adhesin [Psychrobacter luti]MBB3107191.1 hypothetical protein [Psychrobacter luti]
MKKLTTVLSSSAILAATLASGSALAYSEQVMDAATSHDTAVKVRQVNYSCQNNNKVSVTYGFNKQNLPTYASANLNGKDRFLPINLGRSDDVDTVFGDEDNYSIMSSALSLGNYHKSSVNIQDASSKIVYKGCDVKSIKKLKG